MTNYPAIVARPDAWCASCGASWTAQAVAVRFAPRHPMILCGECVMVAAALVLAEQRRRAADDKALRGQDAALSQQDNR